MEIFASVLAVVMIVATVLAIFHLLQDDDRLRNLQRDQHRKADHLALPNSVEDLDDSRPGD